MNNCQIRADAVLLPSSVDHYPISSSIAGTSLRHYLARSQQRRPSSDSVRSTVSAPCNLARLSLFRWGRLAIRHGIAFAFKKTASALPTFYASSVTVGFEVYTSATARAPAPPFSAQCWSGLRARALSTCHTSFETRHLCEMLPQPAGSRFLRHPTTTRATPLLHGNGRLNWQFSGVGKFFAPRTSDLLRANSNTGGFGGLGSANNDHNAAFIGTAGWIGISRLVISRIPRRTDCF